VLHGLKNNKFVNQQEEVVCFIIYKSTRGSGVLHGLKTTNLLIKITNLDEGN